MNSLGLKTAGLGLMGVFKPRTGIKPPPRPLSTETTATYTPGKTVSMNASAGCSTGHADTMGRIKEKWPQLFSFLTSGAAPKAPVDPMSRIKYSTLKAEGTCRAHGKG